MTDGPSLPGPRPAPDTETQASVPADVVATRLSAPPGIEATATALRQSAMEDIRLMLRFAWSRGIAVSPEVCEQLESLDEAAPAGDGGGPGSTLATVAAIHATLIRVVTPAIPVTLRLMDSDLETTRWRAIMGPIRNVRRLLAAAFLFLSLFVAISLSPSLNADAIDGDIYTLVGTQQLIVMIFLLSAAGIGATFQALFTAQRFVAESNYDPRYDGSYWILIALGLVAGLLLSVLVPVNMEAASSPTMAKPLLALLGGFSSGLVYRILQRLVDTVDALFQARSTPQ